LVNQGVEIMDEMTKELVEAAMLFALVAIGFAIYFLYKRKLKRREQELDETFSYIGAVNLQVEQIKLIIDTMTRYPESKKDFRYLFELLAEKALAGVNAEWVFFRIIDINSGNTLSEYTKARGTAVLLKCEISSRNLLDNKYPDDCDIVASSQENLNFKVFCVMPKKTFNKNQEVLLKAIVNNLSMLYLIFDSVVAKKRNNNFASLAQHS